MNTNSLLRHISAVRCLRVLRRGTPMSRADIAREVGLTRATVGNAINPLMAEGLVLEAAVQGESGHAGRPGVLVALNPAGAYFIGIDIASTAISAVLVDLSMKVVARLAVPIADIYADPARVIDLIADLPIKLVGVHKGRRKQLRGICVSVPGIVDRGGRVLSAPWLGWRDLDLRALLAARMGPRWPVQVCNDTVALASAIRSEADDREMRDVLLILLAQGIGGAHVRDGRVMEGAHGFAGEVGHMVMGDRASLAGSRTFEIVAGYQRFLPLIPAGTSIHEGLVALSLIEKPDARLAKELDAWAQGLAAGLLNLIHIQDPGSIVLGGPLAVLYPRVAARVGADLAANLVHGFAVPPIGIARFGADVAAIGAAAIVREALFALPTLEPV